MSEMYGIIERLCNIKGIKPGKMCTELKISRGTIGDLKAGRTKRLSAENMAKIAGYFDVSIDELIPSDKPTVLDAFCGTASASEAGIVLKEKKPILVAENEQLSNITSSSDQDAPVSSIGDPIDYSKYSRIPILGRIPAGLPLLAEENIEGYTLTDLNGGAEYFALRVTGDSMNAVGIMEGHLLHVRKQPEVENGEIAVVMVGDEDATVKRFYAAGHTVTLMPQSTNPIHQPQIYDTKNVHIEVLGKVVKVEFLL